ncbi:unnamed protein product [Hymenolepis diminuta]|uniref:Uncharacterized protein n=1 Tax=Hymenolepis diminuta TaxID=6216 RepID=A0A564YRZ0_HYMDI|nr:unnamed protein product [Hymenolepis diminuta]
MSSHVRRLQYQQQQQQKQAQLQRQYAPSGSFSSLGRASNDQPLKYESSIPPVTYSHLSGISAGGRPAPGSVVSFDQRNYNRTLPEGSIMSFNPPSTMASRSLLGRPSLYAKSSLYRSRSLGASKYVPDSAYTVAVKVSTPPAVDTTEELLSGKTTDKALTRVPIGTRTVNASVISY